MNVKMLLYVAYSSYLFRTPFRNFHEFPLVVVSIGSSLIFVFYFFLFN